MLDGLERILRKDRAPSWEQIRDHPDDYFDLDTYPPGITILRHPKWMEDSERGAWQVHLNGTYGPVERRPEKPFRFAGEALRENFPELGPITPLNIAAAATEALPSAAAARASRPATAAPSPRTTAPTASSSTPTTAPTASTSTPLSTAPPARKSTAGKAGSVPPPWVKPAPAASSLKTSSAAAGSSKGPAASTSAKRPAAPGQPLPPPKRPRRGMEATDQPLTRVLEAEAPTVEATAPEEPPALPAGAPLRKKKLMPRAKIRQPQQVPPANEPADAPVIETSSVPPVDDSTTGTWVAPPSPGPGPGRKRQYSLAVGQILDRTRNPWKPNFNPQVVSPFPPSMLQVPNSRNF